MGFFLAFFDCNIYPDYKRKMKKFGLTLQSLISHMSDVLLPAYNSHYALIARHMTCAADVMSAPIICVIFGGITV